MVRSINILFLFAIFSIGTLGLATHVVAGERARYNFNSDWKLIVGDPAGAQSMDFDDAAWKSVTMPHAWNEDDAFRRDIHDLSTGIAWYRKHFRLPATAAGQKVVVEFEGIRHGGEIWVNGEIT